MDDPADQLLMFPQKKNFLPGCMTFHNVGQLLEWVRALIDRNRFDRVRHPFGWNDDAAYTFQFSSLQAPMTRVRDVKWLFTFSIAI